MRAIVVIGLASFTCCTLACGPLAVDFGRGRARRSFNFQPIFLAVRRVVFDRQRCPMTTSSFRSTRPTPSGGSSSPRKQFRRHAPQGHRGGVHRPLTHNNGPAPITACAAIWSCSVPTRSSIRKPAGPAIGHRSSRSTSSTFAGHQRSAGSPHGSHAAPAATRTWATSSTTAQPPTGLRYCMNSAALEFVELPRAGKNRPRRKKLQPPRNRSAEASPRPRRRLYMPRAPRPY